SVTGSDENVYPPMSDMLREWNIDVFTPYSADNLDRAKPDLVIIGNVIRRVNAEATAVRDRGIPQMSFPAAFGALITKDKHPVVIVGTHGKTTTSALMAHVLVEAGLDPSFLVGGVTVNYDGNFRLGGGKHVVIEGDEYDTAYFDKGPKFLHYGAKTALLTSIEFDHADIYRDLAQYESAFMRFCETVPRGGWLGVSTSYGRAEQIAHTHSIATVAAYGAAPHADYRTEDLVFSAGGAQFSVVNPIGQSTNVLLPMSGRHNVENATGVFAAARSLGIDAKDIAKAFASFRGVKRRQELRGEPGGVLVIDDFAHHPTAVRETVAGIRERYAGRRIWAIFEPRSNTSRRNIHQAEYAGAFDGADVVTLRVPEPHDKVPANEQLDVQQVVAELKKRGKDASAVQAPDDIARAVVDGAQRGDVVLVMSNGAFGGVIPRILEGLATRR
ncbi:MAG TPA: Mur ligase family protein, partial [Gemmatimonadaceae bacterium]|nr:Mur ligase family protein [Gemmatimonadaceae bacterium]